MTTNFRNLQNQVKQLRDHGFTDIKLTSRRRKLQDVVNQWWPVYNSLSQEEKQFLKNSDRETLKNTAKKYSDLNLTDVSLRSSTQKLRQAVARNLKRFTAISTKADQLDNLTKKQVKQQLKRFPAQRPDLRKSIGILKGALAKILVDNNADVNLPQQQPGEQQEQDIVANQPEVIENIPNRSVVIQFSTYPLLSDLEVYFNTTRPQMIEKVGEYMDAWGSNVKLNMRVNAKFIALDDEPGERQTLITDMWTSEKESAVSVRNKDEIQSKLEKLEDYINIINEELMSFRSDWVLDEIYHTKLIIDRHRPPRGSADTQLPECLRNNKGIINPSRYKR
jgi:hypothetical protein